MPIKLSERFFSGSAVCLVLVLSACTKAEAPAPVLRSVRTMTVTSQATTLHESFAGEIKARSESRVGFRIPGKLILRPVNAGDTVRKGQLLAQVDGQDLRLAKESALAAVTSAQANQAQVEADAKRHRELRQQGFIGQAELERRETALKAANATLAQAMSQARVQGNQAGYTALYADVAGVITAVEAEPGQVVSAASPVVRIAHDGPRDVVFAVPEDRIEWARGLKGREGLVKVQMWGSAETLPAVVREVSASADPTTRTFLIKAALGQAGVRLGQSATVLISQSLADESTQAAATAPRVPMTSLFESGGVSKVWVLDTTKNKVHARPVTVLSVIGDMVLLSAGVKPGEEVVTAGVHVLTEGQQVRGALPKPVDGGAPPPQPMPAASMVPSKS